MRTTLTLRSDTLRVVREIAVAHAAQTGGRMNASAVVQDILDAALMKGALHQAEG